jgi:hypothetical protein
VPRAIELKDAVAEYVRHRALAGATKGQLQFERRVLKKVLDTCGNIWVLSLEATHVERAFGKSPNLARLAVLDDFLAWSRWRRYARPDSDPLRPYLGNRAIRASCPLPAPPPDPGQPTAPRPCGRCGSPNDTEAMNVWVRPSPSRRRLWLCGSCIDLVDVDEALSLTARRTSTDDAIPTSDSTAYQDGNGPLPHPSATRRS